MASRDSKIEKWLRWLEEPIQGEVFTMHLHRDTFQKIGQMAQEAKLPDSYFWEYLRDTYATTQAVAVRRQAETDPRVRSLGQLIVEVREDAHRLTRDWWVGLWSDPNEYDLLLAHDGFTKQFAGEVGDHFDPAIAEADLALLATKAEAVKTYVDKHVAHSDKRPGDVAVTFADLDVAIDAIGRLFQKYGNLLTASVWPILVPALQHDWLAPFRVPWITP